MYTILQVAAAVTSTSRKPASSAMVVPLALTAMTTAKLAQTLLRALQQYCAQQ
jgi:hypothetical protein